MKATVSTYVLLWLAGRRAGDMPNDQGPLDPSTKIVEIESLGVKVASMLGAV